MKLVCLGWGSLVWDPRDLPCGEWRPDGPLLPVEFARISNDGRITLVIDPTADDVTVLWAELKAASLEAAIDALAAREGVTRLASIGRWPSHDPLADRIGSWAAGKGIDGVVWTALKPGLAGERGRSPGLHEVGRHIEGLSPTERIRAAEYLDRAPAQITTGKRVQIRALLDPQNEKD